MSSFTKQTRFGITQTQLIFLTLLLAVLSLGMLLIVMLQSRPKKVADTVHLVPTPSPTAVPIKSYVGIISKIEKRDDQGLWFTLLTTQEKTVTGQTLNVQTVTKLGVSPKAKVKMYANEATSQENLVDANLLNIQVGNGVELTVSGNASSDVVEVLKQKRSILGTITGKVLSVSGKTMVLDWYGTRLTIGMGQSVKISNKYDTVNNAPVPGKQKIMQDFSTIQPGNYVDIQLDMTQGLGNLKAKSVMIVNSV